MSGELNGVHAKIMFSTVPECQIVNAMQNPFCYCLIMFKCTPNSKLHDTFTRINFLFSLFSETITHFKQINLKFHVRHLNGSARYWGYQLRQANILGCFEWQRLHTLSNTRWLSFYDKPWLYVYLWPKQCKFWKRKSFVLI